MKTSTGSGRQFEATSTQSGMLLTCMTLYTTERSTLSLTSKQLDLISPLVSGIIDGKQGSDVKDTGFSANIREAIPYIHGKLALDIEVIDIGSGLHQMMTIYKDDAIALLNEYNNSVIK